MPGLLRCRPCITKHILTLHSHNLGENVQLFGVTAGALQRNLRLCDRFCHSSGVTTSETSHVIDRFRHTMHQHAAGSHAELLTCPHSLFSTVNTAEGVYTTYQPMAVPPSRQPMRSAMGSDAEPYYLRGLEQGVPTFGLQLQARCRNTLEDCTGRSRQ